MLKGKTPLIIALVLGLLAGIVAYSAIKKKEADVRRGWNLVPVVVAGQDIPEGTVVTFDMISQRAVPEQFVTSSVVKPDSASYVVNQKVLVPLQAGDPLLWSQFETTKAAERLSTKVQKKARAITIEAGKTTAVGGWVRPNDHVDVIGTFRDPQTQRERGGDAAAERDRARHRQDHRHHQRQPHPREPARVQQRLAAGASPRRPRSWCSRSELGKLTLSLRNEDDVDMIEERGRATINTLLSGERTRVLAAEAPRAPSRSSAAAVERARPATGAAVVGR